MSQWDTPIGDARLNRALRNADLERQHARQLAQYARETGDHLEHSARGATPAGDERRLRGIPVQARGVGGTIPGTSPTTALANVRD
jgi:hypothetical protein